MRTLKIQRTIQTEAEKDCHQNFRLDMLKRWIKTTEKNQQHNFRLDMIHGSRQIEMRKITNRLVTVIKK